MTSITMTQGKLLDTNKANHGSTAETIPPVPPSYEEATADESPCYNDPYPDDAQLLNEFSWDDRNVRRVFIRKVYTILMIQLLVTLAIVFLCFRSEPLGYYIRFHPGWYWASYGVFFVTYLTLACCPNTLRRQFPWNIILLAIFTLALSYMTAMLTSYYEILDVMLCLVITALVCLSVIVLSFYTEVDITSCLVIFSISVCISGLIGGATLLWLLPVIYVAWCHVLYGVLGAILLILLLAIDTQLLLGYRRYTISPEDYIFAALSIYVDIIHIFTFLRQLFRSRSLNSCH